MAGDLKYRVQFGTTVDKGIHAAFYNYAIDSKVPMSRLVDEALEDFLKKYDVPYTAERPYKKERK